MKITITCRPSEAAIGSTVMLIKEPTNEFDNEAIRVESLPGVKIGYVAAVYRTKRPGTFSAGRAYDKLADKTEAKVVGECVAEVAGV